MSRSKLRSKYMKSFWKGESFIAKRRGEPIHNPHRQDECPKNRPSKYISMRCDWGMVQWLQEPTSYGGHKPRKGGHRMVSGIVRAKVKREIAKEITESLEDNGN